MTATPTPTSPVEELAPCPLPWCPSNDPVVERTLLWMGDASPRRVECACGVIGPIKPTDAEAITAWNAHRLASPVVGEGGTVTMRREDAQALLNGLNARIDAAVENSGATVPVFTGIVALSDALNSTTTDAPAIPAGMVAWEGGEKAPDDWDHGRVWARCGISVLTIKGDATAWRHRGMPGDIIAYTPRATTEAVSPLPAWSSPIRTRGGITTASHPALYRLACDAFQDSGAAATSTGPISHDTLLLADQVEPYVAALTPHKRETLVSGEHGAVMRMIRHGDALALVTHALVLGWFNGDLDQSGSVLRTVAGLLVDVGATTDAPAIPTGMKPWAGGEKAPDDWDRGAVQWFDVVTRRDHISVPSGCPSWEAEQTLRIIAYATTDPERSSEVERAIDDLRLFARKVMHEPAAEAMVRAADLLAALRAPADDGGRDQRAVDAALDAEWATDAGGDIPARGPTYSIREIMEAFGSLSTREIENAMMTALKAAANPQQADCSEEIICDRDGPR